MTGEWDAQFYNGETAQAHPARVRLTPDALWVTIGDGQLAWPYDKVQLKQGYYPGEVVRLDHGAQIVVIRDRSFLLHARVFAPHLHQKAPDHNAARSLGLMYGGAAAGIVLLIVLVWMLRSTIESGVAGLVPVSFEEAIGEMAAREFAPESKRCTDPQLNADVQEIVNRLVEASNDRRYTFRVNIVNDPMVNALAAPAGHVVLFQGLLRLTDDPAELAGVMAHEVQHVLQRHTTKSLVRYAGLAALFGVLTGDASGFAAVAGQLGSLSFARGDEEEADREGMKLIQKARLDPEAMVSVYRKLQKESADLPRALQYLSTHPNTGDRVKLLAEQAEIAHYPPEPLQSKPRWREVSKRCK